MSTRKIPSDAFEYYVGLGPERSYRAVAQHYNVSKRAVTNHATKEDWHARLEKIEAEARERSDRKMVNEIEEMRERHLQTLKAMNTRALTALKQYPLTTAMEAMRAAEMVIKLERLIAGEPSERTATSIEAVTKREMQRWLTAEDEGQA